MELSDYLPANGVMIGLPTTSKKQIIEDISDHAGSLTGLSAWSIFDALMQRERLGSTAIGSGTAIPHAVFAELERSVVIITLLDNGVEFGAHDKKPVYIIVTILGPDQADCNHLKLLSTAAKHLADIGVCQKLQSAKTPAEVRQCFEEGHASAA